MKLGRVTKVIIESMADIRQRMDRSSQAFCNQIAAFVVHDNNLVLGTYGRTRVSIAARAAARIEYRMVVFID